MHSDSLPPSLLSSADAVIISSNHLAGLLGPDRVPHTADPADAITRYGAESVSMQIWFAWVAAERFKSAWQEWIAEVRPASGVVPRTI